MRASTAARPSPAAGVAAWGLFAASAVVMGAGRWVDLATARLTTLEAVEETLMGLAFLGFPAMGALIASRRPRNPIGWILLAIGGAAAVMVGAMGYTEHALVRANDPSPLATIAAWFEAWLWYPIILTIPTFLLLLFPSGRLPSPRWRWVAWAVGAIMAVISLAAMLQDRLRTDAYDIDNPIGIDAIHDPEAQLAFVFIATIPLVIACLSSLVIRYRRGTRDERQQLKWVAFAGGVLVVLSPLGDALEGTRFAIPEILFPITLTGIPVSIAISVLKYRLYDLERIVNRALVYTALTTALVLVYAGTIFALQAILAPVTKESDVAVAASTLAVAALFRPIRARVQRFIDRRFYRSRYDAQRTLEEFSTRLRDEVDLHHLASELVHVVTRTVQPKHASLWLREPAGGRS